MLVETSCGELSTKGLSCEVTLLVTLQDLQRGSTQGTEYAMQLLAMMDAAVQAASSGTHVEAFLEVCLPCLHVWIAAAQCLC